MWAPEAQALTAPRQCCLGAVCNVGFRIWHSVFGRDSSAASLVLVQFRYVFVERARLEKLGFDWCIGMKVSRCELSEGW